MMTTITKMMISFVYLDEIESEICAKSELVFEKPSPHSVGVLKSEINMPYLNSWVDWPVEGQREEYGQSRSVLWCFSYFRQAVSIKHCAGATASGM